MKVLISRSSPDVVGGAELSAFDQAVALKELGHEPVFATNLRQIRKRATSEGIKTIWFPWINRGPGKLRMLVFFSLLPFVYVLAMVLSLRIRPDIINPHSREDQIMFTLTKWLHYRPVIWKDPGDLRVQLNPDKDNVMKRSFRRLHINAIKKADHIYLLNDGDQENLVNIVGQEIIIKKTSAIPASILYRYYNRDAAPKDRPTDKLVVGTLARAEENKGLQYLLEAIRVIGCSNSVEFWLVNDGAHKQQLQQMAHHLPCVSFYPYTPDISAYLNTFDVLVHPPEIEGWGRIIKEAMYFGVPVIGSNVGGIKRQITDEETGLLVEVGDVDGLKRQLDKLITDKALRKRLGNNARKKAEADGDFTEVVKKQIIPLYKKYL